MKTKPSSASTISWKETVNPGIPLYIHIPFCVSKCHYCDFNSYAWGERATEPYMQALFTELAARAPKTPRTIFIGGGTPSFLSVQAIAKFLEQLEQVTNFRSNSLEITFECNPESLTLEKAKILRAGGVNRLSIGFQSFQDHVLRFYDRAHSAKQAIQAYHWAREAGFNNINIDLIFGASQQTLKDWQTDLEQAIKLQTDHLSCYDLIFEPGTTLYKWKQLGRVHENPQERQAEMFRFTQQRLAQAGYERYEISNYAKAGKRCLHNINYWKNNSYIGIGAGAVSYWRGVRKKNHSKVDEYMAAVVNQDQTFAEAEQLNPRQRLGESMMLQLRLVEGVSRQELLSTLGLDIAEVYKQVIAELIRSGLINFDLKNLKLTEKGILLGDFVATKFL